VQIRSDDFMRVSGGVGDPAGQLFHVELAIRNAIQREDLADPSANLFGIKGEPGWRFIAELNRATCKINRSPIQAAWRASLEPPHLKTQLL
jgi:hypothetical protein